MIDHRIKEILKGFDIHMQKWKQRFDVCRSGNNEVPVIPKVKREGESQPILNRNFLLKKFLPWIGMESENL